MTQEQHYEAVMLSDKKIEERIWRDKELKKNRLDMRHTRSWSTCLLYDI
jgi:hypothetical protein